MQFSVHKCMNIWQLFRAFNLQLIMLLVCAMSDDDNEEQS